MKAIRTYETKEEYLNDLENLPVPCISYVKETDESYKRAIKEVQVMRAWVDDFDGWVENQSVYTFEDYIYDPEYCGSNAYIYTGATHEYQGETYYLWEREDNVSIVAYLITDTINFNILEQHSLKYNYEEDGIKDTETIWVDFCGFLDEDNEYYVERGKNMNDNERLVRIEYTTIEKVVDEKI